MIQPRSIAIVARLHPIAVIFLLTWVFESSTTYADTTRIAVAANFKPTLTKLLRSFPTQDTDQFKVSSGSTGMLYAQIRHGAPFDLFLAADSSRPELLEADGFVVMGSRSTYAIGRLALWVRNATTRIDANYLSTFTDILAMANPETAPYGSAGQELLDLIAQEKSTTDEPVEWRFKIVMGNNVAQAFQFVTTGNAQAGIISLSQIKNSQISLQEYWLVDPSFYSPIEQQLVVLRKSEITERFTQFLQSNQARRILHNDGYLVPRESRPQ